MVDLSLFGSTRRYCKSYTGTSYLILVLRSISWSYGSYSCAKVPVGTMSRNRSGSYHIQGQITDSLYESNRSYDWTYTYSDLP